MRLLEFQAKRLFRERGIPVPQSTLVRSPSDLADVAYPTVLKAQVPVGGRGKAGAIRLVGSAREAERAYRDLLALTVGEYPVRVVLAEEPVKVARELYLAVLINRSRGAPMLLAAASGGIEIEETAKKDPGRILRSPIDLCMGPTEHAIRSLALGLGLGDRVAEFRAVVQGAFGIFRDLDATLVEINPLGVGAGGLVALDAKVILDDKAAFRHEELFRNLREEQVTAVVRQISPSQRLADEASLTYVGLEGDIALISDGAGTGMLTLDLIQDAGGRAACFCELGTLANADGIQVALDAVLADSTVRVVLVSLIGGLTRMDEIAEGIAAFRGRRQSPIPLVVRMAGTQEERGRAILQSIGIAATDDLPAAVGSAVSVAKEGRCPSS